MNKWVKILIIAIVAIFIGLIVWYILPSRPIEDYKTRDARIKSITKMVELCASDIHEEMAIKDSVNGKWIVARQTIEGRIRFDLDSLKIEEKGDTTIIYLPPERVDIFENDSPAAYEVLDSWDSKNSIFSRTLTANEENIIKRRWQDKARKRIYERGYVAQARANAVNSLTPLFCHMRGPVGKQGPVIVIDPNPKGQPLP